MNTYISLVNFTDQGIRGVKDTRKRAEAFTELVEEMGGTVREIFWTLGSYDLVAIADMPSDEAYTAAALKVAMLGNVRTTTLRGFDSDGMKAILDKI